MQVRVLRHAQPGSSVYGWIEPKNSAEPENSESVPWRRLRRYVFEPRNRINDIQAHADAPLIVRSVSMSDAPAWLPTPRAEFLDWCQQLEQSVANPLSIWPTATGSVSDVPSLRTFLAGAEQRARQWSFLFDPISLLTPAMLDKAEDHLTRLFETLAGHPARQATLLADAAIVGEHVVPAPLGSGPLTPLILRLAKPLPPEVVLLDQDLTRQLALL
jgi:hypothetical protein